MPIQEGDRVTTEHGEPATIYLLHPSGEYCVLRMDDQFMPDGGAAFRTVQITTVTKVEGL